MQMFAIKAQNANAHLVTDFLARGGMVRVIPQGQSGTGFSLSEWKRAVSDSGLFDRIRKERNALESDVIAQRDREQRKLS